MSIFAVLLLAAAPAAEPVGITAKSWGKTLSDWTMAADGSITWREAVDRSGGDFRHYDEVTRVTPPDAARRKWLVRLLAPVRKRAATPPSCGQRMTDQVYGEARWGSGPEAAVLRFDSGCRGADAVAVNNVLKTANLQVRDWAHKAPEANRRAAEVE